MVKFSSQLHKVTILAEMFNDVYTQIDDANTTGNYMVESRRYELYIYNLGYNGHQIKKN